jgi:AraC family transcriptional regulator of adaptative response/methylated-DNA-[protein]-cysteine methyltransferase
LQFLTIEHAKALLAESQCVLDTTYEVGLSSPGRLHDLFVTVDAMTPGEFKRQGAGIDIIYGFHASPFGECLLAATKSGICGLSFVDGRREAALDDLRDKWEEAALYDEPQTTQRYLNQLFPSASQEREADYRGQVKASRQQKVNLFLKGTNFQLKVWQALLTIPPGSVCSYSHIANLIEKPRAVRAVGSAIGANPIAYLIPCHRVLRKTGLMTGYRWGATRKKAILGWEAAQKAVEQG